MDKNNFIPWIKKLRHYAHNNNPKCVDSIDNCPEYCPTTNLDDFHELDLDTAIAWRLARVLENNNNRKITAVELVILQKQVSLLYTIVNLQRYTLKYKTLRVMLYELECELDQY